MLGVETDTGQNSRSSYIPHIERPVSIEFTWIQGIKSLNKGLSLAEDCSLVSCHVCTTRL